MIFLINRYQPKDLYSQNIYFYPQAISYGKYKVEGTIQVTLLTMLNHFAPVRGFIITTTEKNAITYLMYLIALKIQITQSLFMKTNIIIKWLKE